MKGRILLIDTLHPSFKTTLEANNFIVDEGYHLTKEEVLSIIDQYNGVAIRSRFKIDRAFIEKAKHLKFIARAGAGMENIDEVAANSFGINLINAPEGNRDAVGEQAIGMLLALMNNLIRADKEVRNGFWKREENRGLELKGKTVGIIGFGNMGTAFAKKIRGFEVEILVNDPYKKVDTNEFEDVNQVELNELIASSDIISMHVPLTAETRYMVNDHFFKSATKPLYLINTSRGKVVDTNALVSAMKTGIVKGACIDVIEYESTSFEQLDASSLPEPFQYLLQSDRVILSPHIAGWTHESNEKISNTMAQKIMQLYV
jgi:D-3-phosphoglycerate dehydrogenase